jgi:hypothetical protein
VDIAFRCVKRLLAEPVFFFASVQLSCNERSSSAFSCVATVIAAKPQLADSPEGMNDGFDA